MKENREITDKKQVIETADGSIFELGGKVRSLSEEQFKETAGRFYLHNVECADHEKWYPAIVVSRYLDIDLEDMKSVLKNINADSQFTKELRSVSPFTPITWDQIQKLSDLKKAFSARKE